MMFGELRYGEKEYQFQIEDMELSMWEKNSKGIPLYFFKEDLKPIDEVLYGTCLPKGNTIAIYVNGFLGTVNNVMRLKVELIVEYVSEKEPIERVSMTGPEINRVFPVGGLIKDNVWNADDNTLSINIKAVESKAHGLTIDDKEVVMKYESSWSFDKKDNEQPIKLISWLTYSFQPEDDLGFIYLRTPPKLRSQTGEIEHGFR